MSRPLRIEYNDAFYHVMSRGNNRQAIYLNDDDYEVFLETLKEASRLFSVKVVSYCLMPNHYHLLLTTPKANLSRFMRHLNGVYTQRFNRIHKKDGHLFRGRYKAILVQEDEYLTHLIRYIHLNPVTDYKIYPWSSHKDYLKAKNQAPWLHIRLGLAFFSGKLPQALKAYKDFMSQGVDPKTQKFYASKNQSSVLGDPDFLKDIKEKYIYTDQKLSSEIPEERRSVGEAMFSRVVGEVVKTFSVPREVLFQSKRGESCPARFAAITLTRELSGLKHSEISDLFQIKSYRTVGSSCYRFKKLIQRDRPVYKQYLKIYNTCSQGKT